MYELTDLFTTIAGCTATIVAILGGFIASKLITLSTERFEILARLVEINEELSFKSSIVQENKRLLDEDDALDFIQNNIEDAIYQEPLESVYKEEERPTIAIEDLNPYWDRATTISKNVLDIMANRKEVLNEDSVPVSLASTLDDFEYRVSEYAAKFIERQNRKSTKSNRSIFDTHPTFDIDALGSEFLMRHEVLWYQRIKGAVDEANSAVSWLKIQRNQMLVRKDALRKPKGMISGLIIFALFSLFGIVAPLIAMPFSTENYNTYLLVKCCYLGILILGLATVFIYLISLLSWKEKGEELSETENN